MITKEGIQSNVVDLSKSFDYLLLTFATGVGKTLSALKVTQSQLEIKPSNWLILCEEISHIDNWEKEFIKHKLKDIRKYFTITTYASSNKYSADNIILDECHHAISDRRAEIIKSYKAKKIIALSATLSDDKKSKLNEIASFKEYHISLEEAIRLKLLPEPEIIVKYKELDNKISNLIFIKNRGLKKLREKATCDYKEWKHIYFKTENIELSIRCTEEEYYRLINDEIEFLKKQHFRVRKKWSQFLWLNKASQRKAFISSIKTQAIKDCLEESVGKRKIVFTGSIAQCEELGKNTIHSKNSDKLNNLLIQKFNKKRINNLFCVKKLREGVNLVDIEVAIISQIDSEDLSFYQMLGRSLRGENPKIYMIIIKNTQDEVYFESIKKELDKFISYE